MNRLLNRLSGGFGYPTRGMATMTTTQDHLIGSNGLPKHLFVHGNAKSNGRKDDFEPHSYGPATAKTINPAVLNAEYAVRGALAIRAEELRTILAEGKEKLPFEKVINCNIGNPQQLGQKPITFLRQVASLAEVPSTLEDESKASLLRQIYEPDAIDRAKELLAAIGSVGAYSHSKGVPLIRKHVAEYIEERDGFPADPESIYLTTGASGGVQMIMETLTGGENTGILLPIPQYPLYTAALALRKAHAIRYYLDETADWGLQIDELRRALKQGRQEGLTVAGLVVINPGNPTGSSLTLENMREVLEFCAEENIVLLADEVYQQNVFNPEKRPWASFKRMLRELQQETDHKLHEKLLNVQLVSFHSISKGMVGECGRRGGYFEIVGFGKDVQSEIYKLASINLCASLQGQIGVDIMVKPPKEGDASFPQYRAEIEDTFSNLEHRATALADSFNKMTNVTCCHAQGSMYLFPKIKMPQGAMKEAERQKTTVDGLYSMELLNSTGICVVPGAGFGQREGEVHIRTTFLAPGVDDYVKRFGEFHEDFMKRYGAV